MAKFKVGDKVRVIDSPNIDKEWRGRDSLITDVCGSFYELGDDERHYWEEFHLEPLSEPAEPDSVTAPSHYTDGGIETKGVKGMKTEQFNQVLNGVEQCQATLGNKAKEYATEDRLHNFHSAAILEGVTPIQSLGGMMAKHTISVYDMIGSGKDYPKALWEEKIYDHINYLILLRALVEEEQNGSSL